MKAVGYECSIFLHVKFTEKSLKNLRSCYSTGAAASLVDSLWAGRTYAFSKDTLTTLIEMCSNAEIRKTLKFWKAALRQGEQACKNLKMMRSPASPTCYQRPLQSGATRKAKRTAIAATRGSK